MDLFPRSDIFMFFVQWVLGPYVLKALIYKDFQRTHSFALVINTTVSTWNDRLTSMSGLYFSFCSFAGIGRAWFLRVLSVSGNRSTVFVSSREWVNIIARILNVQEKIDINWYLLRSHNSKPSLCMMSTDYTHPLAVRLDNSKPCPLSNLAHRRRLQQCFQ